MGQKMRELFGFCEGKLLVNISLTIRKQLSSLSVQSLNLVGVSLAKLKFGYERMKEFQGQTRIFSRLVAATGTTGSLLCTLISNQRGNLAIMSAMLMLPIVLSIGVAIDFSSLHRAKTDLQQLADGSALAAAKEMVLITKNAGSNYEVAKRYVSAHLASGKARFASITNIKVDTDDENNLLTVSLTASKKNAFGNFLQPEYSVFETSATAKVLAGMNICSIGLDEINSETLFMDDDAALVANSCGVFSNSTDNHGINLKSNSNLQSGLVCSVGGAKISGGNASTEVVTDCPPIEDPLQARTGPAVGGCAFTDFEIKDATQTLMPGTYCGGLKVKGSSTVNFEPGIYIIKDGILEISGHSVANGSYVGFYFTGDDARMKFTRNSTVSFVAPRTGEMAGMLFFQDPVGTALPSDSPPSDDNTFKIDSNNAETLLGTIYLPRGKLIIDSQNPVAAQSAFTVVVTQRMQFIGDSSLVLNSDYSATDVPAPAGVKGSNNAKVYLTK